jgi:hypothetical protein
VALRLPVYHVLEAEFKSSVDPGMYDSEIAIMGQALDKEEISSTMEGIRKAAGLT